MQGRAVGWAGCCTVYQALQHIVWSDAGKSWVGWVLYSISNITTHSVVRCREELLGGLGVVYQTLQHIVWSDAGKSCWVGWVLYSINITFCICNFAKAFCCGVILSVMLLY